MGVCAKLLILICWAELEVFLFHYILFWLGRRGGFAGVQDKQGRVRAVKRPEKGSVNELFRRSSGRVLSAAPVHPEGSNLVAVVIRFLSGRGGADTATEIRKINRGHKLIERHGIGRDPVRIPRFLIKCAPISSVGVRESTPKLCTFTPRI